MKITVELSFYPFAESYDDKIMDFLQTVTQHSALTIETNNMSTQISGEYDEVMSLIQNKVKDEFDKNKAVFVLKIANSCDQ